MNTIINIVAHEKRRAMAESLSSEIQAEKIWFDNGFHGEWRNHKRAWTALAESDSTHAVILQDDSLPIPNFREELEKTISRRPDDMISLYVGTHRPQKESVIAAVAKAEALQAGWLASGGLHWGVGLVIPTHRILSVLQAARPINFPYDQRMGMAWMKLGERKVSYCWPSLVDHDDVETVAHKYRPQGLRKAHKVGTQYPSDKEVWILNPNMMGSSKDQVT